MSDDQFTKLFTYMEKRFDDVDRRFAEVDRQFAQVMGALDHLFKAQDKHEQERLAMIRQLDRHEQWIEAAAPKLDLRYN
jgi:ferritin